MTALAADRNTASRDGILYEYPVAADKLIYAGSLVVLDSSGNAEPGSTATGKICVGRAEEQADNSGGAAAAINVKVRSGCFKWGNGETITKAHIGDQAYILDDQTVYRTGTSKSPCGVIVDVESDGVWVQTAAPLLAPSTGLLAANNLSDVGTVATARSSLGLDTGNSPTFTGLTLTGAATVGTTLDVTGRITGLQKLVAGGAAYTVGSAVDGDAVITTATDTAVITLPDAAAGNAGKRITVLCTAADGAALISVSPHSSDKIYGTVPNAAADSVSSAGTDKDFQLTKVTQNKGDHVILVSDGTSGWYIIGGVGIWASEA